MGAATFHNVEGMGRLEAFSHAAVAGDTIYVCGTLGTTGNSLTFPEGGTGPQTTQTLRNIAQILESVGAATDDIVKVNVYLADMGSFAEMNDAYMAFFAGHAPARITVGGADLALGAAVEIDCIAYRPQRG